MSSASLAVAVRPRPDAARIAACDGRWWYTSGKLMNRALTVAYFDRLGVPPLPPLDGAAVLAALQRDKKATEAGVRWVLPERLGQGRWGIVLPPAGIAARLGPFLAAGAAPARGL